MFCAPLDKPAPVFLFVRGRRSSPTSSGCDGRQTPRTRHFSYTIDLTNLRDSTVFFLPRPTGNQFMTGNTFGCSPTWPFHPTGAEWIWLRTPIQINSKRQLSYKGMRCVDPRRSKNSLAHAWRGEDVTLCRAGLRGYAIAEVHTCNIHFLNIFYLSTYNS